MEGERKSRPMFTAVRALVPYAETLAWIGAAIFVGRASELLAHPTAFFVFGAAITLCTWRRGRIAGLLSAILGAAGLTWLVHVPGFRETASVWGFVSRLVMFGLLSEGVAMIRRSRDAAKVRESELARIATEAAIDRESAVLLARRRQEALAVLDTLLASSPVGFAYVDRDFNCVLVNRVLAEMNGVGDGGHAGRPLHDALPVLASRLESTLHKVIETGQPMVAFELDDVRPTGFGRASSWLVSAYPVRTPDQRLLGTGIAVVDISERKQLEGQLSHAMKMEAVGRLAGGIAHDFNNILTAIKTYSQLLRDGLPPDDPRAIDAREIQKSADRATALTRQLLAFSRKQLLQPRVLDLNDTVAEMERMLVRLIGEDVELVIHLAPESCWVRADPGQVEQVLMNLAVNARDAMPDGGVLLIETDNVMRTGHELDDGLGLPPGSYVTLSVRDTGIGMSAETLGHVFEPFFTTKGLGQGTGLGLATVYGIVKQSDGDVVVRSTPGRGTTVDICLPRLAVGDAAAGPRTDDPASTPNGNETVLLVEDDESLRPLMRRVLETHGYAVLEARHGKDAMRVATGHGGDVDLVITDVVMPEMGGRELAERLASARPSSKILFVSGYTDDVVIRQGILDKGRPFLQKPFTPQELLTKAREVLRG
jgi:PAS domain S-box-containing protein